MSEVKPQPGLYNGQKYDSTLEARIAVFMNAAGARAKYALKQQNTGNGVIYTPDFMIRNAHIAGSKQLSYIWIEGKEALWSKNDETKMMRFSGADDLLAGKTTGINKPLLVMNDIPFGNSRESVSKNILEESNNVMDILDENYHIIGKAFGIFPFNSNLVTGQYGPLTPCVKVGGGLYLESLFDKDADVERSISAYRKAKEAHFKPYKNHVAPGIYEFKLDKVEYDEKSRGAVNCPGWRLYMTGYSQDGDFPIVTRMHSDGFCWKFKDFCKSIGISYNSNFMNDKTGWFWNDVVGKKGRFLIEPAGKGDGMQVADFWPTDGSRPEGNKGRAEWEKQHG